MSWKLILPMELCKPLLLSASSIRNRDNAEQRNKGPKYMLDVKSLSAVHPDKKPKNDALVVCPYVWTSSGLIKSGIDAAAPLDVIADAPNQPAWWYQRFHDPLA